MGSEEHFHLLLPDRGSMFFKSWKCNIQTTQSILISLGYLFYVTALLSATKNQRASSYSWAFWKEIEKSHWRDAFVFWSRKGWLKRGEPFVFHTPFWLTHPQRSRLDVTELWLRAVWCVWPWSASKWYVCDRRPYRNMIMKKKKVKSKQHFM